MRFHAQPEHRAPSPKRAAAQEPAATSRVTSAHLKTLLGRPRSCGRPFFCRDAHAGSPGDFSTLDLGTLRLRGGGGRLRGFFAHSPLRNIRRQARSLMLAEFPAFLLRAFLAFAAKLL